MNRTTKLFAGVCALIIFAAVAAYGQMVSAPAAREQALAMTGGGTVDSMELVSGPDGPVYRFIITNAATRFEVSVDASTGNVTGLSSLAAPAPGVTAAPPPATPGPGVMATPTPRHGGTAMPQNPPVSRAAAVDIARAYLASRNIRADFRSVKMDWERGRWVWEVEFRDGRTEIEFYIDVHSGEIVKFEIER
ncbi:MAG: PepSY domain-containing protein [Treponema sp.]|nr:PepSY domain-containing protein [Treponema sp.]